jgi:hypothetical protein
LYYTTKALSARVTGYTLWCLRIYYGISESEGVFANRSK